MANTSGKKEIAGILIENGRLSFDDLYEPTASVEGGRLKYRCNIIIDPTTDTGKRNIKKIENLIRQVELEKFKKSPATYKTDDRKCFVDGDSCVNQKTGEVYDGYAGMAILKAANDNKTYAGCYCNFFIRIYAVSGADKGGNGLFASLETVQFVKDGEPFGGAPVDPKSVFKNLEKDGGSDDETEDEEDPLA
jgi:hypothetical protein